MITWDCDWQLNSGGGGGSSLVRLSPQSVKSDAISRSTVSELSWVVRQPAGVKEVLISLEPSSSATLELVSGSGIRIRIFNRVPKKRENRVVVESRPCRTLEDIVRYWLLLWVLWESLEGCEQKSKLVLDETDVGWERTEGNQSWNQGNLLGSDCKRLWWLRAEWQQWGGENWSNSGFILKVELTTFTDGFDAGDLHV